MFAHYLKIAFRNQWKYKSQTLISVLGLAVGFTCFALATLWIRYDMTFDSFHKDAKRMYMALIIVLCVGWQVFRASVENPAEVVKKE